MDIPCWAWFIIGFFVGIGAIVLCAVILIYLKDRNMVPPEIGVMEDTMVKVYSIGKNSGTKIVKFEEE